MRVLTPRLMARFRATSGSKSTSVDRQIEQRLLHLNPVHFDRIELRVEPQDKLDILADRMKEEHFDRIAPPRSEGAALLEP